MAPSKSKRSPKSSKRSPKTSKSSKTSKRSPKTKVSSHTGFCLKCRKQVKVTGCKLVTASNGRLMLRGKCVKCGTTVCAIVKNNTKKC